MKKRLLTLICLLIALVCSLGALTGCDLVTTNFERDMNQVVAEVNIGGEYKGGTEKIYKKDMIMGYMSYGYYYAQQGGYSSSELFQAILDNLINERILLQTAKAAIKEEESLTLTSWKADNFVTDNEEKVDAQYTAIKNIDSLIKQYIEKETTYRESYDGEARTIPTDATNKAEELTATQKTEYVNSVIEDGKPTEFFKGEIGSDRRVAYNKTLKLLEANGLLGDKYETGNIFSTYYYENVLESCYETKVKIIFEQLLIDNQIELGDLTFNNLTYQMLKDAYVDMYNAQAEKYENDIEAYKTALGSQTKTAPIVYAGNGYNEKFGYVYNLLIGATEEQTEAIGKIDKKKESEKIEEREKILDGTNGLDIIVKDLRSSWVYSGYDAEFTPDEVGGDEGELKFINDFGGYAFQGKVKWLNKVKGGKTYEQELTSDNVIKYFYNDGAKVYDEDYVPEFAITQLDEVTGIDNVLSLITTYVYGSAQDKDYNVETDTDVKEEVNELIFAYSTDPGSLNSFKGYLIMIDDENSSYVKEFQSDGEKVLGYNLGSLIVCITDYGYHFMFNAGMVEDYTDIESYMNSVDDLDNNYATWELYFDYLMSNWADLKEEDTNTYLYFFANQYMEKILNNYASELERITGKDDTKVVRYQSRYADLING